MMVYHCVAIGVVAILSSTRIAQAGNPQPVASPMDLLRQAVDPNPTLRSYVASTSLSAVLNVPIPIHKTFKGTAYYVKPTQKIVFENVTGPLSKFEDLTATTPTFDQALAEYSISVVADNGMATKYSLIPKKQDGRVTNLMVSVDDITALITHVVWTYTNGGVLSFDQTYETLGIFRLPSVEKISARFPGYSVDGVLRFSDYQLNVPVDPSLFEQKQ
jgi:hypothetical protein